MVGNSNEKELNSAVVGERIIMTFRITNIIAERSLNGTTTYYAKTKHGIAVSCSFANCLSITKEMVKEKLMSDYLILINRGSENLNIGDVL